MTPTETKVGRRGFLESAFRSQSIRQKLTIGAVGVMLFCTAASAILLWFTLRSVSSSNLEAVTRNTTVTAAAAIGDLQRRVAGYADTLSRRSEIAIAVTGGNVGALEEILVPEYRSLKGLDRSVTSVEVTSRSGKVLLRGHAPDDRGEDPLFPQAVREAVSGHSFTGLAVSLDGRSAAFVAVSPLSFAEMVVGAVAVGSALDQDTAAQIREKTGAEIVFFVGGAARTSTIPATATSRLRLGSDVLGAIDNNDGVQTTESVDGRPYQVGYVPLRSGDGKLVAVMAVYVSREEIERTSRVALLRFLVILGALSVVIAWVVINLSGRLAKPVATLSEMGLKLAERDLRPTPIASVGTDEIGRSVTGMFTAIDGLRRAVEEIAHHSSELGRSAQDQTEISRRMLEDAESTSHEVVQVSSAAEEVSANMSTAASAVEEMHASIAEIARNSGDAAVVAQSAVKAADEASDTINSLGRNSQQIDKVVQIITSIAEQTNLLALNATIESARAGEAGRGFSVVADEVRKLARQTASATGEIEQQIKAIQSDSRNAVGAIAEISSTIGRISDVLQTIATAVEQQTATTAEIGNSVAEAARGSGEIAESIAHLSGRADETSATAEQTRTTASSLSELASRLQKLVNSFKY